MDRPERLIKAFESFDADGSGKVSTDAMKAILTTMGNVFNKEELNEFVADADENGWIDYRRFVTTVIFGS
jgi:Ca2+-binding EF-hand superfamily protein